MNSNFDGYLTDEDNYFVGLSYLEVGYPQYAIEFLIKVMSQELSYEKIDRYLGLAYYMLGEYDLAEYYFNKLSKTTEKETKLKENWAMLLGFNTNNLPCSIKLEKNFIYRFMDDFSDEEMQAFIRQYTLSYEYIKSKFSIEFDKKIDVYVYRNQWDKIGNILSYANPPMKMIQTHYSITGGHEIAHIFLHYIHKQMKKTRFIDEGFATYYDQEQEFNPLVVKATLQKCDIDVLDYWVNYSKYQQKEANLVAGQFVAYLLKEYNFDVFIEFLKDQRVENGYRVFGESFKDTIKSFNKQIKFD